MIIIKDNKKIIVLVSVIPSKCTFSPIFRNILRWWRVGMTRCKKNCYLFSKFERIIWYIWQMMRWITDTDLLPTNCTVAWNVIFQLISSKLKNNSQLMKTKSKSVDSRKKINGYGSILLLLLLLLLYSQLSLI